MIIFDTISCPLYNLKTVKTNSSFDWLLGPHKGQNFEKKTFKNLLLRNCQLWMNPLLCIHVPDSSLYIICVFLFQSDKNSGCYGNFKFP